MKPNRTLIAVMVVLAMIWCMFSVCGLRTQRAAAAAQKVSEADLRREKYILESAMTAKLVVFRRSLYVMDVAPENVSSRFRLETNKQNAELTSRLAAAEKNLTTLDASSRQDWKGVKSGVEDTFEGLAKSFDLAKARFN